MSDTVHLDIARKQIEFAREYTLSLIGDIDDADWFRMPSDGVTHLAWQVGHLAMAQYGLGLYRLRGRQEIDKELMPSAFRKQFSKGSTPDPDAAKNPSPAEIRQVFDRVHAQVLEELTGYTDAELDTPVDPPHAVFNTKLGGLFFCSQHEMMHAGQIGLLRLLLGKSPLR